MKKKQWKRRSSFGLFSFNFLKGKQSLSAQAEISTMPPEEKRKLLVQKILYVVAGIFFLISPYFIYKTYFYEPPSISQTAQKYAESVLEICDDGNIDKIETLTPSNDSLTTFFKNRAELGKLKSRKLAECKPMRRQGKNGSLVIFNSSFENASNIQERLIIELGETGNKVESIQFSYYDLPRPTSGTRPGYPMPDDVRRMVRQCVEAFDSGNINYFKRMTQVAYGRVRNDMLDQISNWRDESGKAASRKVMNEYALASPLPGCPELQILIVTNRTVYNGKETEERVWLKYDGSKPQSYWEVYAFNPGIN